ncbi:MAG: hypothetical protein OXH57_05925 [Ekhidna sp.]|nr:hypothetical protein [Ekhidna sp.]
MLCNCTDFGIQYSKQAGIKLKDSYGSWPGGSGSNPGNLGEDIRKLSSNLNYEIIKSGGHTLGNS